MHDRNRLSHHIAVLYVRELLRSTGSANKEKPHVYVHRALSQASLQPLELVQKVITQSISEEQR
jgi:hypothetical protein